MSSNNLQQLIEQIAEADNNVQKGKDFERLVKFYLQNDPQRKQRFKKVYLWNEWPKRDGADTGVDLVAEGYQGEYCAVQAKCKAKQHDIELCSMDDPKKYGEELYRLDFSEAVKRDLLSDYKVRPQHNPLKDAIVW